MDSAFRFRHSSGEHKVGLKLCSLQLAPLSQLISVATVVMAGFMTVSLIVLITLFFAFSIGLNLGLYGVISLDSWHQTSGKEHASNIFQKHDAVRVSHSEIEVEGTENTISSSGSIVNSKQEGNRGVVDIVLDGSIPQEDQHTKSKTRQHTPVDVKRLMVQNPPAPDGSIFQQEALLYASLCEDYVNGESVIDGSTQSALAKDLSEQLGKVRSQYDSNAAGPVELYLSQGGHLPIVLMTYNRVESLQNTIDSLLAVRGVEKSDILIFQGSKVRFIFPNAHLCDSKHILLTCTCS